MSIFDDDLIDKLKQEAKLTKQEEGKKRQEAAQQKEKVCAYIMECLQEFPAAAKKIGLRTQAVKKDTQYFDDMWWVGSDSSDDFSKRYYIRANGDCYVDDHRFVCISLNEMADKFYSSFISCRKGEKKIKECFMKILSGSGPIANTYDWA